MTDPARELWFDLLHSIGHGGQADVYLAHLRVIGGHFACKLLREAWDPIAREEFRREGLRQTRVAGEHVVRVIAHNFDAQQPFIVLEYMPRGSLADEIARRGTFGLHEALTIVQRIAVALADLHSKGVVHRDLKPGNILRALDGSWKLNDLGHAATINPSEHVRASGFFGTPVYAAPEQLVGLASAKSDVYALGVIMEELLLGAPGSNAFIGDDRIQVDVRMLIARLRARNAASRPTAAEAAALLNEARNKRREAAAPAAALRPPSAQPSTTVRPTNARGSGWGWLARAAGVLGVLALASSGGGKRWDPSVGRYRWSDGTFAPD